MVKLTLENLSSKVGKRIDLASTTELNLAKMQIEEVGTFGKMVNLEKVDFSGNWFRFQRDLEKLFDAPNLKQLDFTGCPVCKTPNYRNFIITKCPTLEVLDGKPITASERDLANKIMSGEETEDPLTKALQQEEQERKAKEAQAQLQKDKEDRERLLREKQQQLEEEERRRQRDREIFNQKKNELFSSANNDSSSGGLFGEDPSPATESADPLAASLEKHTTQAQQEAKAKQEAADKLKQQQQQEKARQQEERLKKEQAEREVEEEKQKTKKADPLGAVDQGEERERQVFVDNRSKLVIATRFESLKVDDEPKPQPEQPKRNLFSEDDLFGEVKATQFKKDNIDNSLFADDDDILKRIEAKANAKVKTTAKPVKLADDKDDLFGSFGSSKPTNTNNNIDDLFSLVDNKSKKNDLSSGDFNFDDYIAQQKGKSSGGLFD